jgi:hypothetical protein
MVNGVKALGATAGQMAWVLVPLALLWGWVGWFLARQEETLKRSRTEVDLPASKATD